VLPRHLQQWVLLGIAVVMIGIIALTDGPTPRPTTTPPAAAIAVDANQQRIEEYQRRIQEQTQRLLAEQAELQLAKQALEARVPVTPEAPRVASGRPDTPSLSAQARIAHEPREPVSDSLSYTRPVAPASTVLPTPVPTVTVPAVVPSADRVRIPALVPLPATPTPASSVDDRTPTLASPRSGAPTYRLLEGTVIETVLTNRLEGTFEGPVNCLVTTAVYASHTQHLLIPAGARVLGAARAVNAFGQSRLAVTFHRVLLPDGSRIELDRGLGLNQAGDVGLTDQVNRHYAQIFGASLALGAIAGFAQARTSVGLEATAADSYRQGIASSVSQSSAHILDRFLNILPTVTIREGHRIKVYVAHDLEVPAYGEPALTTEGVR
jgi:type IV secretion system protein VirB10